MNIFNRALYSLKARITRNIMITLAFTVIFTLILSSMVIFFSASKQIDDAEKNIANAITLAPGAIPVGDGSKGGQAMGISADEAQKFLSSEYLDGYNIETSVFGTYLKGAEPFYKYQNDYDWGHETVRNALEGVYTFGIADSGRSRFFTSQGYEMLRGAPIVPADGTKPYVLVTEEFAEKNGFDVGDEYIIDCRYFGKELPVTIKGIYRLPEVIYNMPQGDEYAHNYQFVPIEYARQVTESASYEYVTAYLKDQKYLDTFIEETKQKMVIGEVRDHFEQSEAGVRYDSSYMVAFDEAKKVFDEQGELPKQLILDRGWFEMVAKPMRNVSNITLFLTLAMIFGALLILILMTVMNINSRKRETGILVSLGESHAKILIQMAMEVFIPILIALILSIGLSTVVTGAFGNYLVEQNASETIEENENIQKELIAANNIVGITFQVEGRENVYIEARTNLETSVTSYEIVFFILSISDVVLLLLCIQMFFILRLKPADILMNRR